MEPIVNPGVSCQRQQRGKMTATQPKWRQLCVEYGGLLEIVFFSIKVTFVGYQFLTDFDSQNRCVCSMRSHGPLLCAFCLCFHFKMSMVSTHAWTCDNVMQNSLNVFLVLSPRHAATIITRIGLVCVCRILQRRLEFYRDEFQGRLYVTCMFSYFTHVRFEE